ncbi:aspartate aminotransferase family protein [Erysipelotrichaceae bacterium RD49]|nr:aspartate aminotransferase family protein [Erysipelotrichaceae bacterium RD49]
MDFETLKQVEHENLMQTYGRFDVALDHGDGCVVYDLEGNPYLDLTSGIGVNALGHNYKPLVEAISRQAGKMMQASNLFYTKPMIEAAAKLNKLAKTKKVFYANSGAEANEGMIKIARKYSWDKYQDPERLTILTLKNSFHGRTIATLEATGQDHFHANFFPFTQGFDYVEANNIEELNEKLSSGKYAGLMMELVQGESGVRPLDPAFVKAAEKLCQDNDVLLMIDEVQTGIGRTGALFCYQNYDLSPDLVSCAKGLGGGVPIGAVLASEKTADVLKAGDHGTTFGGNPLAASAANVVLDTVGDPEFLADVAGKGQYFMDSIKAIDSDHIQDVRGMGLMIGIEVGPDAVLDDLAKLRAQGVLALKAGKGTIRLLPPLTLSKAQIDQAVAAMKEVF